MDYLMLFVDYLRYERRYSTHTAVAYQRDLEQFLAFLRGETATNKELIHAQSLEIRLWLAELMEQGIGSRSVNRKISSLKSFYRYAIKNAWLQSNPMLKVSSPKMAKKLPVYVESDKLDRLLEAEVWAEGFDGIRDRLVVELLFATGMRLNELITLTVERTDLRNKQLKVMGKRNKERIIPIIDSLQNLLKIYLQARNGLSVLHSDALILLSNGKAMYPKAVYRIVKNYLGVVSTQQKRSPHVLRHSFATEMLNNGADLNAIKEILGHANLQATQVYTHNSIEKLKQVYRKTHPRS